MLVFGKNVANYLGGGSLFGGYMCPWLNYLKPNQNFTLKKSTNVPNNYITLLSPLHLT